MATGKTIMVKEIPVTVIEVNRQDYISLTDMLKAKDGEFFFAAVGKPASSQSCRRLGSRPAAFNILQPRFR